MGAAVRVESSIDASPAAVRRALARSDTWVRAARASGARFEVAGHGPDERARLRAGDVVRVRRESPSGRVRRWALSTVLRIAIDDDGLPELTAVTGPLRGTTVTFSVTGTALAPHLLEPDTQPRTGESPTHVECTVQHPGAPARGRTVVRRRARRAAELLLGVAALVAREVEVVVAAAVVDGAGRLLAARRSTGMPDAGGWELPGGRVHPKEADATALARELTEELGVTARIGDRVGPEVDLGDGRVLRTYRATLDGAAPVPLEHAELRWLTVDELAGVPWLPADEALLPDLVELLTPAPDGR